MLEFITFRDACAISRSTGEKDACDNEIRESIYEGPCLYEEGGSNTSRSIITRAPSVYLPENDILIMINDHVVVTTEKSRVIEANVKSVRDIRMPWRENIEVTKIELKQAQGE